MEGQISKQTTQPLESYLAKIEPLVKQLIQCGGFALDFVIRKSKDSERDIEAPEYVVDFSGADAD